MLVIVAGTVAAILSVLTVLVAVSDATGRGTIRRSSALMISTIGFTFAAGPLGTAANSAALILLGLVAVLAGMRIEDERVRRLWLLSLAIPAVWLILGFNPNIASFEVLALGVRKSTLVFMALALGLAYRGSLITARNCVVALLVIAGMASVALYLWLPGVEAAISRRAGEYTALFADRPRLQGIYAGPFHAAMGGAFLVLAGVRWRLPKWLRVSALVCGITLVYYCSVRTAYVTVAAGLLVFILVPRVTGGQRSLVRLGGAAAVLVLAIAWPAILERDVVASLPALESFGRLGTDQRLLQRFDTWAHAWSLIQMSPIYGWGPGSAGDTLDAYFAQGQHVTAHNALLKYVVEGGIIGGALVIVLIWGLGRRLLQEGDSQSIALVALLPLVVFGSSGSSLEAIPVSTALAFLTGAVCAQGEVAREAIGNHRTALNSSRPAPARTPSHRSSET